MNTIKPARLKKGDTVGVIAPCWRLAREDADKAAQTLRTMGFNVKYAKNAFSDSLGFAGTPEERASDFNTMIADKEVSMITFCGGEVCNEILPYIDFENIRKNPKIICSFSDSTTLLNAVYARTGLVTFYGASFLRTFTSPSEYNMRSFEKRIMTGDLSYDKSGEWRVITEGKAEGTLIGGYLINFAVMQGGTYFGIDKRKKYILFIEDHESFSIPGAVSKWLSHIEQSGLFENISGMIVGHYSESGVTLLDDIIRRVGIGQNIPVVRTEDFGHGAYNSIFPVGIKARLDTLENKFEFLESGIN